MKESISVILSHLFVVISFPQDTNTLINLLNAATLPHVLASAFPVMNYSYFYLLFVVFLDPTPPTHTYENKDL